jgi:hypothetical protein
MRWMSVANHNSIFFYIVPGMLRTLIVSDYLPPKTKIRTKGNDKRFLYLLYNSLISSAQLVLSMALAHRSPAPLLALAPALALALILALAHPPLAHLPLHSNSHKPLPSFPRMPTTNPFIVDTDPRHTEKRPTEPSGFPPRRPHCLDARTTIHTHHRVS